MTVDGIPIALAHVMEAMTKGMDRVILRNGQHVRIDRPEFARLAELVEAAAELRDQPTESVRLSHHDLHLWDELAEVGIVDEQAARWVHAAQALRSLDTLPEVDPVGLKAELRSYQHDGFRWLAYLWQTRLGGILADDMGLGKTMQTLALVAHARDRGADPFLVVAPTSVVGTWAHEAAQFTPGLVVRVVSESQARAASRSPRWPRGRHRRDVVHAVPARAGRLPLAALGRAGARRGAGRQEPPRQDLPGGPPPRRAVPAGADRHADGEPPHGAVVAAVDRGAGAVPMAAALRRDRRQPRRAGRRPRGAGPVPPPHPAVPAAPHQGARRRRPPAQAGAGARGLADPATPGGLRHAPAARTAGGARAGRRLRPPPDRDLPLADPAAQLSLDAGAGRRGVRRRGLGQDRRARRPPARGRGRGPPRAGVQPVHVVPATGARPSRPRGHGGVVPRRQQPRAAARSSRASGRATTRCS